MKKYFIAFLSGIVSFIFYYMTLAPSILWGDPAKLTNQAYTCMLRLYTPNHALHNLIGHFWGKLPFADYAYGQNMISAIFSAATIIIIFLIVSHITGSIFASVTASVSLMLSHTFWWLSVINESYSLAFFCFTLAIMAEVVWFKTRKQSWLYLTAFSIGLGISDHFILAIFIPGFIFAAIINDRRLIFDLKKMAILTASFIIGSGLLLYIYFTQHPHISWSYMVEPVALESQKKMLRELFRYPAYVFFQFPFIAFFLGLAGLWQSRKIRIEISLLLFTAILVNYLFSAMYMWQRQPNMMTFGYIIFAVYIGIGTAYLEKKNILSSGTLRFVLISGITILSAALYSFSPYLAGKLGGNVLRIRTVPYRDNDIYFLNPNKRGYYGARRFAEDAFKTAEPQSVIISDFTPYTVLEYLQRVEKKRPDIKLVDILSGDKNIISEKFIDAHFSSHSVYLVDIDDYPELYKIGMLSKKYSFIKTGPLYKLMKKKGN